MVTCTDCYNGVCTMNCSSRDPADTYEKPPHGWTCFFCGETFTTPGAARDHFGADPIADAACRIKVGEERGLVMALRNAEAELQRYRAEDSDADRRYYAQQAEHAVALNRAEEHGYTKGVHAARVEAQPLIMAAAKFVRDGLSSSETVWNSLRRAFERYPICSDCPGWSYGDRTRCQFCPRRSA